MRSFAHWLRCTICARTYDESVSVLHSTMPKLAIVILNYRTPNLVVDCLRSFAPEVVAGRDVAVVVDNQSGDGSPEVIEAAISAEKWQWASLIRSPRNDGFSAGNNVGIQTVEADAYFLVNSDTIARPGILNALHDAMDHYPRAGIISPRLEWPDGEGQISCFRHISPTSEFLEAAKTGPISKLLRGREVAIDLSEAPLQPKWTSFASVLVRKPVIDTVGLMDEGFFMYFEDVDYCRRVNEAGWQIQHVPTARMVHLRGGTSEVKAAAQARRRRPAYFYAARSRYFAKYYGGTAGVIRANMAWSFGRIIALLRELAGNKEPHTCEYEARDIWTNWRDPLNPSKRGI